MAQVSEPSDEPEPSPPQEPAREPARKPRPFEGWGSATARALSLAAAGLVALTSRLMGQLAERSGSAYGDFQARPEHARWRAYALGSYGLIAAFTLMGQLYTTNPLEAYVRVQRVEVPAVTNLFVRNDSHRSWKHLRLTLNGIYGYETNELKPGAHVLLPINRFAIFDAKGKSTYAPKEVEPRELAIDCDEGHHLTELGK